MELSVAAPARSSPSFAGRVARFVREVEFDGIPAEDRETVHRSWADAVGTALAGTRTRHGQIVVERGAAAAAGSSTVLGTGLRRDPVVAAEVNATLAHADDFDDMGGYGHPSVALVPAILALAELRGPIAGTEAIAAHAVGFELAAALCRAGYDQYESCLHSTPVFGVLAAACASARVIGLSECQTAHALGIAASCAGGIGRNSGTMVKPLHAGQAAGGGVLAALMAEAGMTAAPDVFEARGGFAEALYRGGVELDTIARGLGDPFTAATTIAIKKYPCCGSNHSALDAVANVLAEHRLSPDDIAEVTVHAMSETSPVLRYPEPRDGLEAKFSIQFTIAQLIRRGTLGLDAFTDEQARDPELRALARCVTPEVLGRWERRRASKYRGNPVTIVTRDGRRLHGEVRRSQMHGSPADPLSWDEIAAKFSANAAIAVGDTGAAAALAAWRALPELGDIRDAIATVRG